MEGCRVHCPQDERRPILFELSQREVEGAGGDNMRGWLVMKEVGTILYLFIYLVEKACKSTQVKKITRQTKYSTVCVV